MGDKTGNWNLHANTITHLNLTTTQPEATIATIVT